MAELLGLRKCLGQTESELGCIGQFLLGNCCKVHIIWAVCKPDGACPGPQPGQGEVVTDATPSMHLQQGQACGCIQAGPQRVGWEPESDCTTARDLLEPQIAQHLQSARGRWGAVPPLCLLSDGRLPHKPPSQRHPTPTCTAWSMTFRTTLGAMTLAAAIWPRAARFPTLSSAWAAFSTVRRAALSSMRARAKSALQQEASRSCLQGGAAGHSNRKKKNLQSPLCNKGQGRLSCGVAGRAWMQAQQSFSWQSLPCSTFGV